MKTKQSRVTDEMPSVLKNRLQVKGNNNDFLNTYGPRRHRNSEKKI